MLRSIEFSGLLRFVNRTLSVPVTSVAPSEKVIPYSLLATTCTPTSKAQLPVIVKSEAGTNSRAGFPASAAGANAPYNVIMPTAARADFRM
jgi:hypothetical protein